MGKLVDEASIPALLAEMSVKEKVDLLTGRSTFSSPEMPQYGIPSILYLDGARSEERRVGKELLIV